MSDKPIIGQMIFGGIFIAAGLMPLVIILLTGETESLLYAFSFMAIFGLAGFWVGGFLYFIQDWPLLNRINVGQFIPGLLFCLPGLMVILMAIFGDDSGMNAPRVVVGMAGLMFFMAGLYVIRLGIDPVAAQSGYDLISTFIISILLTCFAGVAVWAVIGAGNDATVTIGLPFVQLHLPASRIPLGGICFMPGALMLVVMAVGSWLQVFKLIIDSWTIEES